MEKESIKKVVYSATVGDLFHYGHLKALKFASSLGDYYICGVLTNEAAKTFKREPIANLDERKAVIEHLNFVDRVMIQNSKDSLENLKKIYEEFRDAKIILVRSETWKDFPEKSFLDSINGEIVTHPYYKGLSDFRIVNHILKNYKGKFRDFDDFTNYFKIKDFIEFGKEIKTSIVSTKANTLKALQPLLRNSTIEKTFVFTIHDWESNRDELLKSIKDNFSSDKIVIRSSALVEDTSSSSMAGYFHTELNVDSNDLNKVGDSIKKVIDSYNNKNSYDYSNQILVQKQTESIKVSGVLFTRNMENNAPYYVINYDDCSGSSETVTKGLESKNIKISKFCDPKDYPNELYKLLIAVKEIEEIIPDIPLDIEFAINNINQVIIFQVRPLVTKQMVMGGLDDEQIKDKINELKNKFLFLSRRQSHLVGDYTFFGDMPDWNPAEIIGNNPNFLDYSLYDYIITDSAWHEARTSQGYYNVNPAKLVVLFGNKPYVDVRSTFNSFTPNSLSDDLREKLLNFYMNKLRKNPELQDKVEFEILYTCYDLSFDERSRELLEEGFTKEEIYKLKKSLISLTNNFLVNSNKFIQDDLDFIDRMESSRKKVLSLQVKEPKDMVINAIKLLDNCRENGTVQFSRLARLAFVGKIILESIVREGAIDQKFYDSFLESVNTVAKSMSKDFSLLLNNKLNKEDFLRKYGHLRPGTYDITSQRYDKNENLFKDIPFFNKLREDLQFVLDKNIKTKINEVLRKEGNLKCDAESILNFVKLSLEARELSKFEFTKSLSDVIELISDAGEKLGFSREHISYLDVEVLSNIKDLNEHEIKQSWEGIIKSRKEERYLNSFLILPSIIFSENDFNIVSYYTAKPNFITQKRVIGEIINLNSVGEKDKYNLKDKIVVLESGDPGYDWIFTKNISGLITKYGGVASHMAIRCAEFGIPAAIGCGDLIFDKISTLGRVDLNCEAGKLEIF